MGAKALLGILPAVIVLGGCVKGNDRLWADGDIALDGEPAYEYRILNHWDNLDDSVERGYAGQSIWSWTAEEIPAGRINEYGLLNQKIGINGSVLNNVNASPKILDREHLERVAKIADILREYGIRTYLSINFATPMVLGGLPTADPLSPDVITWWKDKVEEIYSLIPDFGGFLVKASSEGQPGPQDFGRSHVDGANMLAGLLAPHDGIVMWRSFVYSAGSPDRAMQAMEEFEPLDGQFLPNVVVQVKNGPIDFQPREPFSPLFGKMPHTSLAPELQITQEYLGQENHSVFLSTMWEECLDTETYSGRGTVANVTSGAPLSVIAGVANTGDGEDWCGNIFAQSNWYAFGRLAWDPTLSSEKIAEEWLRLTFPKPSLMSEKKFTRKFVEPMKGMMLSSRESCVDYMMPLGLHHIFAFDHHYGPEPWGTRPGMRPDWQPPYYHKADKDGIGFDRTRQGSGAVDQYNEPLASTYDDISTCPEELLLWFHHVPWDYKMNSGRTLWDEICLHYDKGVKEVEGYVKLWDSLRPYVDKTRHRKIADKLSIQLSDARWWRDACVQYFASLNGLPVPEDVEKPVIPLDSLKRVHLDRK
ncbi:MAG: alpha-glucuronidase [Bacteroidales bacterium]|nr:alpha-glucuronidase [Bacteroidales bacterium]